MPSAARADPPPLNCDNTTACQRYVCHRENTRFLENLFLCRPSRKEVMSVLICLHLSGNSVCSCGWGRGLPYQTSQSQTLIWQQNPKAGQSAKRRHTAVTAHFWSKQLLLIASTWQTWTIIFSHIRGRPRWLIRSDCSSKLRRTGLEYRPGSDICHCHLSFVHMQCSKLFKDLECVVLSMVLCALKNPWSHSIRVPTSSFIQ